MMYKKFYVVKHSFNKDKIIGYYDTIEEAQKAIDFESKYKGVIYGMEYYTIEKTSY